MTMTTVPQVALALPLLVLAGCPSSGVASGKADAATTGDGAVVDEAGPYRHTITLDGTDDFAAGETFPTTSASFTARIAWDDANLYIGYSGPDLATDVAEANTKWLLVYLDTANGGEAQSEMYNTQRATFPTGFAADYYVRYKVNGTLTSLEQADAGDWVTASIAPTTAQAGMYVELAVPLAAIGATTQLGIVTWMINEKMFAEGTFAGVFANNFTDGYAMDLALTSYVEADLTSSRAPNDPAAQQP